MILLKCKKCKRVAVEISKEEALKEGCIEVVKECDCGNSYKNFIDVLDPRILPKGVTLSSILRKDDE